MKARVHVSLKNGVLDPQGKAMGQALHSPGFAPEARMLRAMTCAQVSMSFFV